MTGCGTLTPATSSRLPVAGVRHLQLFVLVIAAALVVVGCSSDEPVAAPTFQPTSPIEELLGVPIDPVEAAALDDALRHAAIARCMDDRGHSYTADPFWLYVSPAISTISGTAERSPEFASIDAARTLLNRLVVIEQSDELSEPESTDLRRSVEPNFDPDRSLDEENEWLMALSGPSGCLQETAGAATTDPNRSAGLVAQFDAAVTDAYASDQDTTAGATAWRACMLDAGHDFDSPGAAEQIFDQRASSTGALTDDEIASLDDDSDAVTERIIADIEPIAAEEAIVAEASQGCVRNWLDARAAVRAAVADDFVDRLG